MEFYEEIRLEHLVNRYRCDVRLLEKHPEHKEMLERRINKHKDDIVAYVTNDNFFAKLATLRYL